MVRVGSLHLFFFFFLFSFFSYIMYSLLKYKNFGEVVAPVALLSGIALSPESPVRYSRHCQKVVISLRHLPSHFSVWVYPSFSTSPHGRIGWHPTASSPSACVPF